MDLIHKCMAANKLFFCFMSSNGLVGVIKIQRKFCSKFGPVYGWLAQLQNDLFGRRFLNTVYCIFIPSVAKFLFSNCAPYPCCCFSRVLMSLFTRSWWTPRVSFPHLKIRHKQKPMKRSFCRRSGSFLPTIQRSEKKSPQIRITFVFLLQLEIWD